MGIARKALILAVLATAGAGGCIAHGPRVITDPDPECKIPAIKAAVAKHDRKAIPQLISDLNSDDPAIRFYAIDGLHSLTGESFGYRYYDDEEKRKPAVKKWHEWLEKQHK
ncbi:MAG TPA: HEAT repeat domain-containing protein [Tepidisphaeraceae bacterium]|nr:HEAT repeat domain-containing protein [Tepidisphaeraceae bacterium]